MNFCSDCPSVSRGEKIQFLHVIIVNDHWPRLRNELDIKHSHNFINSISCLSLHTFRSQAAKLSVNSNISIFEHAIK